MIINKSDNECLGYGDGALVVTILLHLKKVFIGRLHKTTKGGQLTPWLWFFPIGMNSNSSTSPILLAILVPVSPAPAAVFHKQTIQAMTMTLNFD